MPSPHRLHAALSGGASAGLSSLRPSTARVVIVAVVPRIGGTLTLMVGLDRFDRRNMQDNFVLRQELAAVKLRPAALNNR